MAWQGSRPGVGSRRSKAQAVKRLVEGGRGLSEVATELGLSTGWRSTWRMENLILRKAAAVSARGIA